MGEWRSGRPEEGTERVTRATWPKYGLDMYICSFFTTSTVYFLVLTLQYVGLMAAQCYNRTSG